MLSYLEGLTCRDLEKLLACESFSPKIYGSFIKLLSEMNEIRKDCADTLNTLFQPNEKVPSWAAVEPSSQIEEHASWNKVVVLDPPVLKTLLDYGQSEQNSEVNEDHNVDRNESDSSMV